MSTVVKTNEDQNNLKFKAIYDTASGQSAVYGTLHKDGSVYLTVYHGGKIVYQGFLYRP